MNYLPKFLRRKSRTELIPDYNKQVRYGGLGARSLAATIDLMILSFIITPISMYLSRFLHKGKTITEFFIENKDNFGDVEDLGNLMADERVTDFLFNQHGLYNLIIDQVLSVGIITIAFFFYQMKFYTTPGMYMFGLRMLDATTLEPPTKSQFIKRFGGVIISNLALTLGIFAIAFNRKKQGWHDKWANTIVIKK